MKSPLIYKRDATGAIRTWQFEVEGVQWRSIAGLMNGEKTISGWTTCFAKSRPSGEEQATFEANAEMKKKLERDYRPSLEEVDRPRASGLKPMLAQKYEGWQGHCWAQPKLDGIRCIATRHGLFSRQDKPIVAVPHIEAALYHFFSQYPDAILDGELYNSDLKDDFNAITSIVRKTKIGDKDRADAEALIQYHIYDLPSHPSDYGSRREVFSAEIDFDPAGPLRLVPTVHCGSSELLDRLYGEWLEEGFEGQMVRLPGNYEQKRSKLLLKRKEFLDAEFPVVRIEEGQGNWAGYAKKATLLLPDGREFGAGIRGTQDDMLKLLKGPVPSQATVRYFTPTPDGIPRFPVAVAFHGAEGRTL